MIDANIRTIKISPATFDDEGIIKRNEFATIQLEIPLDNKEAKEKMVELLGVISQEWVSVSIEPIQSRMPGILSVEGKTA